MAHERTSRSLSRKIRLRPSAFALMQQVADYVSGYDLQGQGLRQAASDVLDGAVTREELDELIRRRLLDVIHEQTPEVATRETLCGDGWSVMLTERAVRAWWPERVSPRVAEI